MPPRDPQPAISRRKSKLKLDMPEPELAEMLHQYCDLRRRGFDQAAIKTKASWTKSHQKLLLEESQRRDMPGSQKSQELAVTEWLLAMYDAGTELRVIQRTSAYTGQQTKSKLQAALDAASGPAPTGLIIRGDFATPILGWPPLWPPSRCLTRRTVKETRSLGRGCLRGGWSHPGGSTRRGSHHGRRMT